MAATTQFRLLVRSFRRSSDSCALIIDVGDMHVRVYATATRYILPHVTAQTPQSHQTAVMPIDGWMRHIAELIQRMWHTLSADAHDA